MSAATPTIRLEVFEGPLDLLLHLIKRNEVEISDIPIALITDQYLAAIEGLPSLNLDGAGEYLVMAATLMLIKSRLLLPLDPDADGDAEEDPRAELVQQLLEYQRYREAAMSLGDRTVLGRDVFRGRGEPIPRGPADDEPPVRDASLGDLLAALRTVLDRARTPAPHEILRPGLSVAECVQRVLARFALAPEIEFTDLFGPDVTRTEVIVTFLAILELIRLRVVRARQPELFGAIRVRLAVADLGVAAEMVRDVGSTSAWTGGGIVEEGGDHAES
jgi:segregation and condensation protein A